MTEEVWKLEKNREILSTTGVFQMSRAREKDIQEENKIQREREREMGGGGGSERQKQAERSRE